MANLAYLNVFCRMNHPRRRMHFIGYDLIGNAKYRCPWCGCIRRYRIVWGRIQRVS